MVENESRDHQAASLEMLQSHALRDIDFCKFLILATGAEAGFVVATTLGSRASLLLHIMAFALCAFAVLTIVRAAIILISSFSRLDAYDLKLINLRYNGSIGSFEELNETLKSITSNLGKIGYYFYASVALFLLWSAVILSGA